MSVCHSVCASIHLRSGAWVQDTKGEVWPKPKFQKSQPSFFALKNNSFKIEVTFENQKIN